MTAEAAAQLHREGPGGTPRPPLHPTEIKSKGTMLTAWCANMFMFLWCIYRFLCHTQMNYNINIHDIFGGMPIMPLKAKHLRLLRARVVEYACAHRQLQAVSRGKVLQLMKRTPPSPID